MLRHSNKTLLIAAHFLGTGYVSGSTLSALCDWSLSILSTTPVRLYFTEEKTKHGDVKHFPEVTEQRQGLKPGLFESPVHALNHYALQKVKYHVNIWYHCYSSETEGE